MFSIRGILYIVHFILHGLEKAFFYHTIRSVPLKHWSLKIGAISCSKLYNNHFQKKEMLWSAVFIKGEPHC